MLKRLAKLHLDLIKFLIAEIRKRKEHSYYKTLFFKIIKQYLQIMLQEYKTIFVYFDKDYRLAQKKYIRYNELKKDLQNALKLLVYIDKQLEKNLLSRVEKRRFWREFYKDSKVRNDVFNRLMNEIDEYDKS